MSILPVVRVKTERIPRPLKAAALPTRTADAKMATLANMMMEMGMNERGGKVKLKGEAEGWKWVESLKVAMHRAGLYSARRSIEGHNSRS